MTTETILVRFAPDGTVIEIGARPAGTTPQHWFNRLAALHGTAFFTLAGGRGYFRLPAAEIEALAASTVH